MRQEAESKKREAPGKRRCLALSGLLVTCLNGLVVRGYARTHRAEPELKVHVQVCDYAGIPVNTLAEAEFLTAAIFQTAGVKTIWADGVSTGGVCRQNRVDLNRAPATLGEKLPCQTCTRPWRRSLAGPAQ